jgi:predicted transport protein
VLLRTQQDYFAFKRLKNFACVEIHPQTGKILVYVKSGFENFREELGFTRDVRKIGHFATGDLEITLSNDIDLERAKSLIDKSYEEN